MYRYEGSCLPDVYLSNGYQKISTPYGEGIVIHDLPGLHRAIATAISTSRQALSSGEFKFLRRELELSQAGLAALIGRDEQSIARWEKGKAKKIDPAADRLLRMIYLDSIGEDSKFAPMIEVLKQIDSSKNAPKKFVARERNDVWSAAAA